MLCVESRASGIQDVLEVSRLVLWPVPLDDGAGLGRIRVTNERHHGIRQRLELCGLCQPVAVVGVCRGYGCGVGVDVQVRLLLQQTGSVRRPGSLVRPARILASPLCRLLTVGREYCLFTAPTPGVCVVHHRTRRRPRQRPPCATLAAAGHGNCTQAVGIRRYTERKYVRFDRKNCSVSVVVTVFGGYRLCALELVVTVETHRQRRGERRHIFQEHRQFRGLAHRSRR